MTINYTKVKLKEVCENIFSGGTPDTRKPEYWGGQFFWLSSGETRNRFIYAAEKTITQKGIDNSSTRLAKIGDILIASAGQGKTRGQTSYALIDTYINQSMISLRANKAKLYPLYLFYLLSSKYESLRNMSDANAIRGSLTCKMFESINVEIPEKIIDQKRISTILYSYDKLIETNTQRILLLESMAKLIYDEWFVRFKFPGYEKIDMIDSKTDFGEIPVGWEVKKLNEVCINLDSKRIPLSSMERSELHGEYPYYGAAKVLDRINKYIFDGKYLLIAEDGSVVTSEGFPVLQFVNTKFWANNHTHILQGNEIYSTEFLYLKLSKYNILGHITGAAQPKINQENLNRILFITAPITLMKTFNNIVIPIFNQIINLEKNNSHLVVTRDLLLSKLMSGEVDVSDLDIKIPEVETC